MTIILTEGRAGNTEEILGVQFVDGVAELPDQLASFGLLNMLRHFYCALPADEVDMGAVVPPVVPIEPQNEPMPPAPEEKPTKGNKKV